MKPAFTVTKLHQVESACGVTTVVEGPLVHHSPTMTSQYKLTVSDRIVYIPFRTCFSAAWLDLT